MHDFVVFVGSVQHLKTEEVGQLTSHYIHLLARLFVLGQGVCILVPVCHLPVSQVTASKVPQECRVVPGEREAGGLSQETFLGTQESSLGCELAHSYHVSVVAMRQLRHREVPPQGHTLCIGLLSPSQNIL